MVPGGSPQLLSGGSRHGLDEAGEVLAKTVAAHGDEGHAENDVETGDHDTEEVGLIVQGHSDGDEEREGVEERVYHVCLVEVGHDDGAQPEVEEEDHQAHQGGHSLLLSPLPALLPPPAAEDLVVEGLQVVAQEPADQHHVEQEYRQTDGGDTDGQELAQA